MSKAELRHLNQATSHVELRSEEGRQYIEGYASVFYKEDDPGTEYRLAENVVERIQPGAFDKAILEGQDVRALFNHDANELLGRTKSGTVSLSVDDRGLKYRIKFDPEDDNHKKIARWIDKGDLDGSSFGFIPYADGETWERSKNMHIRNITSVKLVDVSPVTYPAYQAAEVRSEGCDNWEASLRTWKILQRQKEINETI